MAVQQIERIFAPRAGRDLFSEVQRALKPYIEKFSLSEEQNAVTRQIRVWRTGFEGKLKVEGDTVRLSLDYSWLIPSGIRDRITQGVVSALDDLDHQPA